MQSQASIRQGYVAGEFMTRTYRISGEVELRGVPVLDQLNDHNALFLSLERMFISPLLDPATLTAISRMGRWAGPLGIVVLGYWRDGCRSARAATRATITLTARCWLWWPGSR